jgi:hypothetical protein
LEKGIFINPKKSLTRSMDAMLLLLPVFDT